MLKLQMKTGVSIAGLSPQVDKILAAANIACRFFNVELVITSANDGKHMNGSKHYTGEALDLRTRDLHNYDHKVTFTKMIADELGNGFDCVLESDHLHVEYDPE